MKLPVTYVWTHDSIGLGEDGPTHQPVEHLAALRAIPGLDVVRPADANETACGLADRSSSTPTGRPGWPDPAEPARRSTARRRRLRRRPRASPAAPTCWPRPTAARPTVILDRHRLRGPARRRRPRAAAGRGHPDPRRVDAVPGVVRRAGRSRTATRCCPPSVKRPGLGRGRRRARLARVRRRRRPLRLARALRRLGRLQDPLPASSASPPSTSSPPRKESLAAAGGA